MCAQTLSFKGRSNFDSSELHGMAMSTFPILMVHLFYNESTMGSICSPWTVSVSSYFYLNSSLAHTQGLLAV